MLAEKHVKYCPNCGAEFIPPQKYCMECGQRLPQADTYSESTIKHQQAEELRGQSNQRSNTRHHSEHPEKVQYHTKTKRTQRHSEAGRQYQERSIYEQGDKMSEDPAELAPADSEATLWGARIASLVATIALVIGIFFKFNVFHAILYIAAYFIAKYLVNHSLHLSTREQRIYNMVCRIQKLVFTVMLIIVGLHMGLQFILTGMRTTFSYAVANIYWPTGSTIDMLKRLIEIF